MWICYILTVPTYSNNDFQNKWYNELNCNESWHLHYANYNINSIWQCKHQDVAPQTATVGSTKTSEPGHMQSYVLRLICAGQYPCGRTQWK